MTTVWSAAEPIAPEDFARVRLRTIFECCRWDPQVEDVGALADFALILKPNTWRELCQLAEALAAESFDAEQELILRPELHDVLGLPREITRQWRRPLVHDSSRDVRVIRFDFHLTTEGWQISEANADVPGGFIEAAGYSRLLAEHYPDCAMAGDPALMLAQAIRGRLEIGRRVVLVHATAFTDDRQVATFLAGYFEREGLHTTLISPAQLRWQDGQITLATAWEQGAVDFVYRFFPAEWLPNFRQAYPWRAYFNGGGVPSCNPTTALLVQSKRFPLVWGRLNTPVPTWRRLLPETRDPRALGCESQAEWVIKPALGRVGEDIGIVGITSAREWRGIQRSMRYFPRHWTAQRRFKIVPLTSTRETWYPCIGVYTINGHAAGAYGRLGHTPLINATATDVAVLIEKEGTERKL